MIWDRYDDAMDDLRDDQADLNKENGELEEKLTQLGVKFKPETEYEEGDIHDHNDMYWSKSNEIIRLQARNRYLKQLLAGAW
jgi:hypothetical protein